MPPIVWEALLIFLLILANGFFTGAEISIIAARRSRLQQRIQEGDPGAKLALDLAENPGQFLPTVQVGITLVGTLAAALGGATLENQVAQLLTRLPMAFIAQRAHTFALVTVVVTITCVTVVLGELVPKRFALLHADTLAGRVAYPLRWVGMIGRPIVWVLAMITDGILWMIGSRHYSDQTVSVEDIEHMVATAEGLLEPEEQELVMEALHLGDHTVKQIMRPRIDIDALDVTTPNDEVVGAVAVAGFSRLPVYEENLDHIIGFVHLKDVLHWHYLGMPCSLRKLIHPVLFVPETLAVDRLLGMFREQGTQLAIVLDEFGGTEGMVTLQDVVEHLVGEIRDEHHQDREQRIIERPEGGWLVDGVVEFGEFIEKLNIKLPEPSAPRSYTTVAGLVLSELGSIPKVGQTLNWDGLHIEVVDMDGPRIDRLLVTRLPDSKPENAS